MRIFARMKHIAAADMHSMLDRCEDPVNMAKHYIRQLEEQIDNTKEALTNQLAAEQEYDLLIGQTSQLVAKRSRQAELAIDRDEEGVAELALQDKLYHQKLLQTYEQQRDAIRSQAETMKREMMRLKELHKELQGKLFFLVSRANAARTIKAAAAVVPSYNTDHILRGFARLEGNVRRMEAGAQAHRMASSQPHDDLKLLDQQEEVRAELERLKAERNK
ncbi:PspA/IM30 family protein [Paenibacillus tarimensis]